MGAGVSNPVLPASSDFATSCMSFQHVNDIVTCHLDNEGKSAIRESILECWKQGLAGEEEACGEPAVWFKLGGQPFVTANAETSVQIRETICKMLEKLAAVGWQVASTAQVGRKYEQSTVFLRKSPAVMSTLPYIGIGLSSNDSLIFVNLPAQLEQPMRAAIQIAWRHGLQEVEYADGVMKVKLRGTPWKSSDEQAIMSKILIQDIIGALRKHQWAFVCNINLKSTTDSLFFRFDATIQPGEAVEFCSISLNRSDRLRLIKMKEDVITRIRQVIESVWPPEKIQKEKDWYGSHEFKLEGIPWHSSSDDSIKARYLIIKVLEAMREKGWHNIAAINMSRRGGSKSVLVFQQARPSNDPIMCLALAEKDKFRLINMKPDMVELFKTTVLSRWGEGYETEKEKDFPFGKVWQMKLYCEPWHGGIRNDTIHAKSIILHIIEEFYKKGWKLYTCGDVSSQWIEKDDTIVAETGKTLQYPNDSHSMFFVYDPQGSGHSTPPTYGFGSQQYGMTPYPTAPPTVAFTVPYPPLPPCPGPVYPPTTAPYPPQYSPAPLYPPLSAEPPSYTQATGGTEKQ